MKPYYQDDLVTLYHGDCRDVIGSLECIDLLVTDPPYSSGARRDAEKQVRGSMLREGDDEDWFSHDAMTAWGFSWFLRSVLGALRDRLPKGSHLYVFTDWRQQPNIYGMLEATGYRVNHSLTWDKQHYGMGAYWRNQHENIVFASCGTPKPMLDRGMGSVLRHRGVSPDSRVHPTEKPEPLLLDIIRAVPGDVVFDPFAGSGSTLVAAKRLGRRAIGVELEEEHCEVAANRCRQGGLSAMFQP